LLYLQQQEKLNCVLRIHKPCLLQSVLALKVKGQDHYRVHHTTYSCQVKSRIGQKIFFTFCADWHTHAHRQCC